MSFINTLENWTVSNRDLHELTSKLFPIVTNFIGFSKTSSSEDLMPDIDTPDLACSNRNLLKSIFGNEFPTNTLEISVRDTNSSVNIRVFSGGPDWSLCTNG